MKNSAINLFSVPEWVASSFPTIRLVLMILMVIMSVALILVVLIQPSNSDGSNAITGQSSETFYAKNKSHTLEGILKRLTIVLSISLAVISLLFFVTIMIYSPTI